MEFTKGFYDNFLNVGEEIGFVIKPADRRYPMLTKNMLNMMGLRSPRINKDQRAEMSPTYD